jgi:eukaryotic-like serine/threonine-protein kinase
MSESAPLSSPPVARRRLEGLPDFRVGDVIDKRYELMRDIGRGAAGVVFEARHRFTHRRVALKLVSPDSPRSVQGELRARLLREARALAAAHHPSIVDVLDGGVTDCGTPYVVLEMLEGGRTLEGILATRGKVSIKDAVAIGLQMCDALGAAHDAGVVHRDVKPGNIIVMRDRHGHEILKLVDFGIAQIDHAREGKLTSYGAIVGTPEYMAPEQLLAHGTVDKLADVYALGVTLYECISGRVPFVGNYQQVLLQAGSPAPPPPLLSLAPAAGARLGAVIDRAISKDRARRYPSVDQLERELANSIPTPRRRTLLFGPPPLPASAQSPNPLSVVTPAVALPVQAGAQRRRAVRANYSTPVNIVMEDGRTIDGRTEDVSEGGLLIIVQEGEISQGNAIALRFALPMEGKVVTCRSHVRWVRASHGRRAIGVEFENAPPELAPSVTRYIELMGMSQVP